jgi:hypothetical protein
MMMPCPAQLLFDLVRSTLSILNAMPSSHT